MIGQPGYITPPGRSVPNAFPVTKALYRIAIIGEAPGADEEAEGKPFVGASGRLLDALLSDAGVDRSACFVGNICQVRPPSNDISKFKWEGPEIQEGLATLERDLKVFEPNICLCLGGSALHAFKSKEPINWDKPKFSISSWRGSLGMSDGRISGYKFIPAFHPAALLRVFNNTWITRHDFRRARKEAESPTLELPKRALDVEPNIVHIVQWLEAIHEKKLTIALDIEGGPHSIYCVSIAVSPTACFIIPFTNMDGTSYWAVEDECTIWRALNNVLSDPTVPKILQNCLFDRLVFMYFGILVRGIVDDTMLLHWEHMSETPKSLAFQVSLYTRQPYYKGDVKVDDDEDKDSSYWSRIQKLPAQTFWNYCCLDSATTFEARNVMRATVKEEGSLSHYNFNLQLLNPMLYMEKRGILIDNEKKTYRILELQAEAASRSAALEAVVGHAINVRSPKQVATFLYDELKLPMLSRRGQTSRSTDYETVLKLYKKSGDSRLMELIRLREVAKRISDLESLGTDPDGRVRFSYNVVGTVTGRVSCHKSPTGAGCNGQTISDANPLFQSEAMRAGFRDLFIADPDHYFFQCDLSGADGWTVAAHCARLGDPTMLDDLLHGIKIPKVIALIIKYGPSINRLGRAELKLKTEEIKKDDHLYFSCKQVQHGTNYGMKPPTVALRVLLESYGEISLTDKVAASYQDAYLSRYKGVLRWHDWVRDQIRKGFLVSATGHKRVVTGRKESEDTLKELLSNEPQENTTYATNLAALKLWKSKENRAETPNGGLWTEPLHQVHDALCGQFPIHFRDLSIRLIQHFFDNTITIAGIPIKIPFDGRFGKSWDLGEGKSEGRI